MDIVIGHAHTVKQYLIDYLSANNMAKKLQLVDMFKAMNQDGKLLKPIYDIHLDGLLLEKEKAKPLYRLNGALTGTEEEMAALKAFEEVAFYSPLLPTLDDITQEVWEWQTQFDGRASISGVLNHLKNEIKEFEETQVGTEEQEKEFADLYILLMHLAALSNIDVRTAVASKLDAVRKRDYSSPPDEQGCITHKK